MTETCLPAGRKAKFWQKCKKNEKKFFPNSLYTTPTCNKVTDRGRFHGGNFFQGPTITIVKRIFSWEAKTMHPVSNAVAGFAGAFSAGPGLINMVNQAVVRVVPDVLQWRRAIHQMPELGNMEFKTAALVAEHLRGLGYDVRTGVANTGVIGVLSGKRPGPTVALRADMDALPVPDETGLPFASVSKGISHACGHDAHTAILMGVASVFAGIGKDFRGHVKLIFQPAEEGGVIETAERGAKLMIAEDALKDPRPDAIFGLHVDPRFDVGTVAYRSGTLLMGSERLDVTLSGRQTHAGMPWLGVDTTVVAAQVILGLQTIVSRQIDITRFPVVISIGNISGWSGRSVIPQTLVINGTIRTSNRQERDALNESIRRTVEGIAQSAGATAQINISEGTPPVYNDPELMMRMLPALRRIFGESGTKETPIITASDDFARYQLEVPGLYLILGVRPEGVPLESVAFNHSPRFLLNEGALAYGVSMLSHLALEFLSTGESFSTPADVFASPIAVLSDSEITERIRALGSEPTSFDIELYREGLKVRGRTIALDLDQTMEDYVRNPGNEGPQRYYHYLQLKPGIVAYLAGLAVNNQLMIYTATPASRLVHVFNLFPELKPIFGFSKTGEVEAKDIDGAPNMFTKDHWSRYMVDLLRRYKDEILRGGLSASEMQVIDAVLRGPAPTIRGGLPHVASINIKIPSIAEAMGKLRFDTLVDDSDETKDYALNLAPEAVFVHFRTPPPYKNKEDTISGTGGEIRDLAAVLSGANTPGVHEVKIGTLKPEGYPIRGDIIPYSVDDFERDFVGLGTRVVEMAAGIKDGS